MKLTNTEVCKCPQLALSSNHPLQVTAVGQCSCHLVPTLDHSSITLNNSNPLSPITRAEMHCEKMKANLFYQSKILRKLFLHLKVFVNSAPLYSCFRWQWCPTGIELRRKIPLKVNLWYKPSREKIMLKSHLQQLLILQIWYTIWCF